MKLDLATCATLACTWEVTAFKPGNVYRGADFADVTCADFLTSAALLGPLVAAANRSGVGRAVLESIRAINAAAGTNTSLGTVLLLAPLAAVPLESRLSTGIGVVLGELDCTDTEYVYEAIRLARPGGLGRVEQTDVQAAKPPTMGLVEAMGLAAERDLVARQYTNDFREVFWVAERIAAHGQPLSRAILLAFLELLATEPDSLITRKCGSKVSRQASDWAAEILTQGRPGDEPFDRTVSDLDFWLRSDGNRRNPGTSADLVAAGLFVLLREDRLTWPVRFY